MTEAKQVAFSEHALERMSERGVSREEVEVAVANGERLPVKSGRVAYRKNFPFEAKWKNRYYDIKQVMPVTVEEEDKLVVVTVYAFYIGGKG